MNYPGNLLQMADANQQAFSFVVSQLTKVEAEVYQVQYPDFEYASLVPVDSSGPEWVKSITFFSMDIVGRAKWISGNSFDMPYADVVMAKGEENVYMAGIGYEWNLEEINTARLIGRDLGSDKARAARQAVAILEYNVAMVGDTEKNLTGVTNNALVTAGSFPADGTGSSVLWADKTPALILRDINSLLTGIFTGSQMIEMADTLLLPVDAFVLLSQTLLSSNIEKTVLSWIRENNIYTIMTGRPLTIRAIRGLEDMGAAGVGRAVAYRADPSILKMHKPMPHRFLPVWQNGPMNFMVPGLLRLGGVEVRRPGAMRYGDGLVA